MGPWDRLESREPSVNPDHQGSLEPLEPRETWELQEKREASVSRDPEENPVSRVYLESQEKWVPLEKTEATEKKEGQGHRVPRVHQGFRDPGDSQV